jgi:hypothetical protein
MEIFSKLFDVHKIPFKILIWVSVVTAILLFSPDVFLDQLRLTEFITEYGSITSLVFIASFSLVLINSVIYLTGLIRKSSANKRWEKNLEESLWVLDDSEKAVLREFIIQQKNTIMLPIDNPTVVSLINKGIVYRAANTGRASLVGMLFPCTMREEVDKSLTPSMIDFPTDEPTQDEITFIRNTRPNFVNEVNRWENLFNI